MDFHPVVNLSDFHLLPKPNALKVYRFFSFIMDDIDFWFYLFIFYLKNKIVQVLDRMERYNYSMNEDIRKKKYFKNPSIYEKLIERYEINEYGSNFAEVKINYSVSY